MKDLDTKTMEAVRELARIEVEIAAGKATISKIHEEKEAFLKEREVLEIQKINEVLAQSEDVVKKIGENFDFIHSYYNEAIAFSKSINEVYEKLHSAVELFSKQKILSEQKIVKDTEKLSKLKEHLENERKSIEQDKKLIESRKKSLVSLQNHVYSQQASTREALKALKKVK